MKGTRRLFRERPRRPRHCFSSTQASPCTVARRIADFCHKASMPRPRTKPFLRLQRAFSLSAAPSQALRGVCRCWQLPAPPSLPWRPEKLFSLFSSFPPAKNPRKSKPAERKKQSLTEFVNGEIHGSQLPTVDTRTKSTVVNL